MSFHDPHSDVSRLNREASTRAVPVHPWAYQHRQSATRMDISDSVRRTQPLLGTRPRIVSVIAYSTPPPAAQPLDLPPVVTNGAAPVSAKAVEGLPLAHPPVPKTRKRSNATPSFPL
jgi:hypothetical protein